MLGLTPAIFIPKRAPILFVFTGSAYAQDIFKYMYMVIDSQIVHTRYEVPRGKSVCVVYCCAVHNLQQNISFCCVHICVLYAALALVDRFLLY